MTAQPLGWRIAAVAGTLAAWSAASGWVGEESLAGPWETLAALLRWLSGSELWASVGHTLLSATLGLLIAAGIAVPSGLLIGSSRFAQESTRVGLDFLSSIPPVCFLPLGLLLFGPTLPMKLLLVGYGACFPLLIRTIDALRDIDAVQHDVIDSFGVRARVRWLRVYLPAALPGMIVGLRISLVIALLLSIAAEYVGGAPGIGGQMLSAQHWSRPQDAQAFAIVAAALGLLLNVAMRWFERRAIGWHPSVRSAGAR